jgi:hypothetical protein
VPLLALDSSTEIVIASVLSISTLEISEAGRIAIIAVTEIVPAEPAVNVRVPVAPEAVIASVARTDLVNPWNDDEDVARCVIVPVEEYAIVVPQVTAPPTSQQSATAAFSDANPWEVPVL